MANHVRRKLLFVIPFPPRQDATHGGSRVMGQLLMKLAERHTIAVLYLRAVDEPSIDELLAQRCELVEEIKRPVSDRFFVNRWLYRLQVWYGRLLGVPEWVTDWTVSAYAIRLRSLVQAWQPDLVQFEYHVMGQYFKALEFHTGPKVLVEYEPGTPVAWERLHKERGLSKIKAFIDVLAWRRYERTIIQQVEAVVVFTEHDRQVIQALSTTTPVVRIGFGTFMPESPLSSQGHSPPALLFVGNFVHPPNIDAADRLIHSIFPRVQQKHPHAKLLIVGNQPPAHIQEMACDHIHVTGWVPDVTLYLDSAAVVVVPIRLGGGMRVKVLEALGAGKAIVASARAVDGLSLENREHYLLAESDQEFADAIDRLLSDEQLRAEIGMRARAWASANLGWEQPIAAYESLYEALIQQQTEPSGTASSQVHTTGEKLSDRSMEII